MKATRRKFLVMLGLSSSAALAPGAMVSAPVIENVIAGNGYAAGGLIGGPRMSDLLRARLSRGEFLIKADAIDRYGVDLMRQLNRMKLSSGDK